ncbi:PREDICTED: prokineticin Bo8-like [Branchiostoma belcheri]|uniref:Prokineticin Bo8-like n=1 Tax=Branchiostoma belcheri TaxID=7741 RepID=A0A6P4YDW9_BRABE|nr:PREDICTED: prokineticin Bo8-like [Branchiostoma belcheri]
MIIALLYVLFLARSMTAGLVLTGACVTDTDCMGARGEGWCCAKWNPGSTLSVCKKLGVVNDICHTTGSTVPYPFDGIRQFWRCPCGDSLECVPITSETSIGRCGTGESGEAVSKRGDLDSLYDGLGRLVFDSEFEMAGLSR